MSDIMNASDALLTDFSSAAVDYLLLDRPIGFVLMDYVDYEKTRGFIIKNPLDYMPGEKLYSLQDIMRFISDVVQGKDDFREERAEMRKKMHNETTCYCERILNRLHLS